MLKRLLILFLFAGIARIPLFGSGDSWLEVRSDHFTILTDSNEQQGRHVLDHFERMRSIFQTLFPRANLDPTTPIVVLAARNRESFQALEPETYLAKGQMDLAGCFLKSSNTNYVLLRLDGDQGHPFANVYHEYTHLQFAGMSEWIPLWLNEGLAEFFENTEIEDNTIHLGQPSSADILLLRRSDLIPLTLLFNIDVSSPYYHEEQKGSVFYAEAWALTHYLEVSDREHGTQRLTQYISLLSQHEDPVHAAEKAFGDLDQLQEALEAHIQASTYEQLILSGAAAPIDASRYQVRTLPAAESDLVRADVLVNVGRMKEARALLDFVLHANPDNPGALEAIGFLEYRAGNIDAARDWYARAVRLDPRNYLAHYYLGLMTMAQDAGGQDALIESNLATALRLNPGFAPASDRLALFYALRTRRLEDARALSLRAIQLDPASFIYRMDASSILMAMQDFREAESVTRAAIRVAGRPEQVQAARSRLAQIEQIDQSRAERNMVAEIRSDGQAGVEILVIDKSSRRAKDSSEVPRHEAEGVISKVTCRYPFVIGFEVIGPRRSVAVYNNNYLALDLTAVGFTPTGEVDPCKDFEGRRARVEYAESPDSSAGGQVTAVELRN